MRRRESAFMESGGYWWLVGIGFAGMAGYWWGRRAERAANTAAQQLQGWRA